jgi:hypothetical protein
MPDMFLIIHSLLIALPFGFGQNVQHLMEGIAVLNWKDIMLVQQNWKATDLKKWLKATDISTKVVLLEDVECNTERHLVLK